MLLTFLFIYCQKLFFIYFIKNIILFLKFENNCIYLSEVSDWCYGRRHNLTNRPVRYKWRSPHPADIFCLLSLIQKLSSTIVRTQISRNPRFTKQWTRLLDSGPHTPVVHVDRWTTCWLRVLEPPPPLILLTRVYGAIRWMRRVFACIEGCLLFF